MGGHDPIVHLLGLACKACNATNFVLQFCHDGTNGGYNDPASRHVYAHVLLFACLLPGRFGSARSQDVAQPVIDRL